MRDNQPVTGQEFEFPDNATLMSTTDSQSHITYANAAFIAVSGFSAAEVHNQPHNLVRHPDMPPEAFADMWATLKGGEPWTALVKNRRKNGDHYWVRANATPVVRDGQTAGYMSVRTKATRDEINGAEALYKAFRAGTAGSVRFHKGLIVRTGATAWRSVFKIMPVRWRIRSGLLTVAPVMALASWLIGLEPTQILGMGAIALVTALAISLWLEQQISKPLENVLAQALRVASGESQKAEHMDRVDEIGMTLRTISQLGLMFRWLIDDVSEQVINVQHATNEITQGNDDLAKRTEQAASNVQRTASSMTEMTSTVKSNAETAMQVNRLSASASGAAEKGGHAVSQVVGTMSEISISSKKISDITGVIDSIAFQTNILALNAAVEAARAGDQGRGFAVVAGEVRALAQRSANAAKEIKILIGESTEKVEEGSRIVNDAGKTMEDIVTQVKRVSDLISEIQAATEEQSSGVMEVDRAVNDLDSLTQQNAALVEQSYAASENLRQQANSLVDALAVFR